MMGETVTLWDSTEIQRLGLGCWAIGGPWSAGGNPAGWGEVSDDESRAAIRVAVQGGIRFFDTAQAYGAGHSETILGQALATHPEVRIATKVGYAIDPAARELTGAMTDADQIAASLAASRQRLQRDQIDLVLLHLNSLDLPAATAIFDRLEDLRNRGWLSAYGWSTDYPDRAASMAGRPGFVAVEHARNVFFAAEKLAPVLRDHSLLPLVRSPLAMGVLGGKYSAGHRFGAQDVRSQNADWMAWFRDGAIAPDIEARLAKVRDLLTTDGRTMAQGALAWLWAQDARAVPLPGFRTVAQVEDHLGALQKGAFDPETFAAIEQAIQRPPEGEPRDR
jgi:aryl-alcohol dehydrogenase-like predicted oxidoreductase